MPLLWTGSAYGQGGATGGHLPWLELEALDELDPNNFLELEDTTERLLLENEVI